MDLSGIDVQQIKANIKELNSKKGLLKTKLKLAGSKQALVDSFIEAIEILDDEGKTDEIPDGPFNFYNELSELEEGGEGEGDEGEGDEGEGEPEPDDGEPESEIDTSQSSQKKRTTRKKPAAKKPTAKKPAKKATTAKKPPAKKKPAAKKPPAKKKKAAAAPASEGEKKMTTAGQKRKVIATNKMSLKFEADKFTVSFADGKKKIFKLNFDKGEKDKLRTVVNNSLKFAVENGATDGQQKALRKSFSQAGWYLTR